MYYIHCMRILCFSLNRFPRENMSTIFKMLKIWHFFSWAGFWARGLLDILSSSSEFNDLPVRQQEEKALKMLTNHLPQKVGGRRTYDVIGTWGVVCCNMGRQRCLRKNVLLCRTFSFCLRNNLVFSCPPSIFTAWNRPIYVSIYTMTRSHSLDEYLKNHVSKF